jgi:hypothetical protein
LQRSTAILPIDRRDDLRNCNYDVDRKRRIGRGNFASVYLIVRHDDDSKWALKVVISFVEIQFGAHITIGN